ncbi:MAG: hypothetical protein IJX02_08085 [Clostridia bacterium]|nr:hypothetical protein [Clostridia bacterium]
MNTAITLILGALSTVISSLAVFAIKKYFGKRDAEAKTKEQEHVLILKAINAVGKLTIANCVALRDGRTNGEMSSALKEYEQVDRELYTYLLEVNSKANS